jgi:vitamin B12 transporter
VVAYLRGGHAFRAPSFNDLYYPGFSNPKLKPERSDQAEAGVRMQIDKHRVNLAYFENRINDLIVFDFATFLPQNLDRARIRGWELQGDTRAAGFSVRTALTVQRPQDRDTGLQLRSRAKQFGSLGISRNMGAWDVGTDIVASGHRYDSSNEAAATRMAGYTLLHANLRYKIDKTWSVEVVAQNLTNRKYELAQGYNTPSRSVFVNVRAIAF